MKNIVSLMFGLIAFGVGAAGLDYWLEFPEPNLVGFSAMTMLVGFALTASTVIEHAIDYAKKSP